MFALQGEDDSVDQVVDEDVVHDASPTADEDELKRLHHVHRTDCPRHRAWTVDVSAADRDNFHAAFLVEVEGDAIAFNFRFTVRIALPTKFGRLVGLVGKFKSVNHDRGNLNEPLYASAFADSETLRVPSTLTL